MSSETPLDGLTFVLRRDDVDRPVKRSDGVDGAVYGGRFHEGPLRNWIARLQQTLATLGFRINVKWAEQDVKNVHGTYDAETEWGVREFQIAAQFTSAVRKDGAVVPLNTSTRYEGPATGQLNVETLKAIRAWDLADLRCPVDVSGFGDGQGSDTVPTESDVKNDEFNLWRDDALNSSTKLFARDRSGEYTTIDARPLDRYQVLGRIQRYKGKYGPVTEATTAWSRGDDQSEVLPEFCFTRSADAEVRERQFATFRIIRAVSDAEAAGFFEGGNAYDEAMISMGLCQWTIKESEAGELPAFLAFYRQRDPVEYEKAFGKAGVRSARVWPRIGGAADGFGLFQVGVSFANYVYVSQPAMPSEEGGFDVYRSGFEERRYFRNLHSYYRFIMAARTIPGYRKAMWDMARMRLRSLLVLKWPRTVGSDTFPFVGNSNVPATVEQTFRSERTLAMLLRWHVKKPSHVADIDVPGGIALRIRRAYERVRTDPLFDGHHDVEHWDSRHEALLAEAILAVWSNEVKDPTMAVEIFPWLSPGNARPRRYRIASPGHLPNVPTAFTITNAAGGGPVFTALTSAKPPTITKPPIATTFHWVPMFPGEPFRELFDDRIPAHLGARYARIDADAPARKPATVSHWRVEVFDALDSVVQQYELERLPKAATITVRPFPLLTTVRDFPGMDVSGLPVHKVKELENADQKGPMATIDDGDADGVALLAALAALTPIAGAARTFLVDKIAAKLPLTDLGLPLSIQPVAAEREEATITRWLIPTAGHPNLDFFTIRRVDATHAAIDWPGISRRYGTNDLSGTSLHVARLRTDLRTLGFLSVPPPSSPANPAVDHLYDAAVRAAVRAFQVYARREAVAREMLGGTETVWVKRLSQARVPEPLRYNGTPHGTVNNETRALIDHWIAEPNRWRCPVVIDARTSKTRQKPSTTPASSFVAGKDNLWDRGDHPDPNHFFFVTDYSIVADDAEPTSEPLGIFDHGPAVRNASGFTAATIPFSHPKLTGDAPETDWSKSTVRVVKAVADHLPCAGFLDGVDAASDALFLRIGSFALRERLDGSGASARLLGSLGALVTLAREVEPAAYGKGFGKDAIEPDKPWTNENALKSLFNDDDAGRLVAGLKRPDNRAVVNADQNEWRGWHSLYRLAAAARLPRTAVAYYDLIRFALLTLGEIPVSTATFTPPRKLRDVFTSERSWGVLHFWHARFPGEVVVGAGANRKAAPAIGDVVDAVVGLPRNVPPLDDDDEKALTQALVDRAKAIHHEAADASFRAAIAALATGTLLPGRISFQLDRDRLPLLPAAISSKVFTAAVTLGPSPSGGGLALSGTSKVGMCLLGNLDEETGVLHATHSLWSVPTTSGLRGVCLPLAQPRDVQLTLEETGVTVRAATTPTGEPDEIPLFKAASGSDVSDAEDDWELNLGGLLGETAYTTTGRLRLAGLGFDDAGDLKGTIRGLIDVALPFGKTPVPLSLAGTGDSDPDAPTFREVGFDEETGKITAATTKLGSLLSTLPSWPFKFPDETPFTLESSRADGHFATRVSTKTLGDIALELVPTLVGLTLNGLRLVIDGATGLSLDLPEGIVDLPATLSSDLFANGGLNTVINHATEKLESVSGDFAKLFKISTSGAGAEMEAGARAVTWGGKRPRIAASLWAALNVLQVNPARRLRTFAGELPGDLPRRCHAKFAETAGSNLRTGRDLVKNVWFVEVPLRLHVNDDVAGTADPKPEDHTERDLFALEGLFRFEAQGDDDFIDFGPGSFTVADEVALTVVDPNARRGRSFAGAVSLHVPDGSVFVFHTNPAKARLEWDREQSLGNTTDRIIVRVPASDGLSADKPLSDPEAKRFTFELEEFGVGSGGLDLAGAVRVENVSLNDHDDSLDEQTTTGFKAPMAVQKAEIRPPGANGDSPAVGTIRFQKSRLTHGSLRAGFALRLFDDANGTLTVLMAEDLKSNPPRLSVTGMVNITTPLEYRLDALYSTFQLKSIQLSTTYKRVGGQVQWSSTGAMAGSAKFLPPAGKEAGGHLAALSDFFSGVSCEFEDLNPVTLGRGAEVTFHFPPKTFSLANVMEVDLNGITVGDNSDIDGDRNRFGLLGDVRLKDLPGVEGALTFGGIDLTETGNGLPDVDVKRIGASLAIPGGVEIDATFERIKNQEESGFAGSMTIRTDALPTVSGLLKLTEANCLEEKSRTVPTMALYMGANVDASLAFGFFLRNLGLGVGLFQVLRGLGKRSEPMQQRIMKFVDDPKGMASPADIGSWTPNAPAKVKDPLNWMLVGQALISYGKFPTNKPHILVGTLLAALDQELTLTAATNLWLFASPDEVGRPEFLKSPVARGAMQISPKEGKVFGYFRTLPNPKLGAEAPPILGEALKAVQTSCMFLADRQGFLTEIGWPWETRVRLPLPSPLKGELSTGSRYGIYRGVVVYGLNFGIDIELNADAGIDFHTPLGNAGAKLVVRGSGYFRSSFVGALDQAFRPSLLGDVRVSATVGVKAEAHAELSRKITKWLRIRLRISFSGSFNVSITAALSAAMDQGGLLGIAGDAFVAVNVAGYRVAGQVPFRNSENRITSVRQRLDEILPPPVTQVSLRPKNKEVKDEAVYEVPNDWRYRARRVPNTAIVLLAILPAPGASYPGLPNDPDESAPAEDRFSLTLKPAGQAAFKGFLSESEVDPPADSVLTWSEDYDPSKPLLDTDEIRPQGEGDHEIIDDDPIPDGPAPRPLTVALFLHGIAAAELAASPPIAGDEVVDPRSTHPSPGDVDDATAGLAPNGLHSPNFGRDRSYDRKVSEACDRGKEALTPRDSLPSDTIDGTPFDLIAAEVLDLYGNDDVARGGAIPKTTFIAHRLRKVLKFEFADPDDPLLSRLDGHENVVPDLIDVDSFRIKTDTDTVVETPLKSAYEGAEGREYDLIAGRSFQAPESNSLCWDFRFTDQKPGEAFEAYHHGFEHFRVTRTIRQRTEFAPRIEILNACWLDPSQGQAKRKRNASWVRPPFQYVDKDLGDPRKQSESDVAEGEVLVYVVEAVGPSNRLLASTTFEIARETIVPLPAPVSAQALHLPKKSSPTNGAFSDDGDLELAVLSPMSREHGPIEPEQIQVRFRIVAAGSVGSYGFDPTAGATTKPDLGLPEAAMVGLDAPEIRFSASPQGRPLSWEETIALDLTGVEWKRFEIPNEPVQADASGADPEQPPPSVGYRGTLHIPTLMKRVEAKADAETLRGRAVELWIGREKSKGPGMGMDRSVLVPCRHAVVLPNVEAPGTAVDKNYFVKGSTVLAVESLPKKPTTIPAEQRFLEPNRIAACVVEGFAPPGTDPNDEDVTVVNDVRIALAWRMPKDDVDSPFDPIVGYRVHSVDRFNPVLYRKEEAGIVPRPVATVRVLPERLYRATPDAIELQPVSQPVSPGVQEFLGDWRRDDPLTGSRLWSVSSVADAEERFPFEDDPDRSGSTCIHKDFFTVAKLIADAMSTKLGRRVRPVWRVREPFEDRADLLAASDRGDIIRRRQRFAEAFEAFRLSHEAQTDPYGWTTLESLGLSAEVIFARVDDGEPVDLDGLIRDEGLLDLLRNPSQTLPVAMLVFHADDGITILNVVRLLHVAPLIDVNWIDWSQRRTPVFDLRVVMGMKLLGLDPLRLERGEWPYGDDYPAGMEIESWLAGSLTRRIRRGLGLDTAESPRLAAGEVVVYRQRLSTPLESSKIAPPKRLPINDDGEVRFDLAVPDRLAHAYDVALEPIRRYDTLWGRLATELAEPPEVVPYSRIQPVKVDRTRLMVPHNILATPLPGGVQAYMFAHPAEFAACASSLNDAAVEYAGSWVYLQRQIPLRSRIEDVLNDREALNVDWAAYAADWARGMGYQEVESDHPGRELQTSPPSEDDPLSMRPLLPTQVGIYGADRYVVQDAPAYYEFRFAGLSAAGKARSPLAFTPFVQPLFDAEIQPPTTEGRLHAELLAADDDELTLTLHVILAHSRLHLRPEIRGLWVHSDETLELRQDDGTTHPVLFGSLPDLSLEYQVHINTNFDEDDADALRVLNYLVGLIPPLEPSRRESGEPSSRFLARSPDEESVQVIDLQKHPKGEVAYVQGPDGSIRLVIPLKFMNTSKARSFQQILKSAPPERLHELFVFYVSRGGVLAGPYPGVKAAPTSANPVESRSWH